MSAFTNLVLTIILINTIGIIGAYIATLVALIVFWIPKAYRVFKEVFYNFYFENVFKHIFYVVIIFTEMIVINMITDNIFTNVNSLIVFATKLLFVVIITGLINGALILANNNVRTYLYDMLKLDKQK